MARLSMNTFDVSLPNFKQKYRNWTTDKYVKNVEVPKRSVLCFLLRNNRIVDIWVCNNSGYSWYAKLHDKDTSTYCRAFPLLESLAITK